MILVCAGAASCGDSNPGAPASEWRLESPDGRVAVTVSLRDLAGTAGYPAGDRLYYRVEHQGRRVLDWSPLGIRTAELDLTDGLRFASRRRRAVDESYTAWIGKRRARRHRANELTLRFASDPSAGSRALELVVRAASDGIAYRYRLLGAPGDRATVIGEESGYRLPDGADGWLAQYDRPSMFTPAYERWFEQVRAGETRDNEGWCYAALFRVPDDASSAAETRSSTRERGDEDTYVLIAEAGLERGWAGTHLAQPVGTLYRVALPAAGEGEGVGALEPSLSLPSASPWRVLFVGSLAAIVESTLIDDLSASPNDAELAALTDASATSPGWIAPGRAAWSWFSQETGDPALQREYIDFAAEMGWEYVLVDARWDQWPEGEEAAVRSLVDYARSRGTAILLWYNSGGPHNTMLSETPRDRMHSADIRRAELARVAAWGVAGIKVDFFHSEKPDRIEQYLDILTDAARERLLVNFHGSTLPRGWQRTFPNLVSMEGVQGAEYYKFLSGPDAIHDVRLAFTRNVVGSMDYTPVTFAAALAKRGIPYGHELALAVVFESGIQHFADRADADPEQGFRKVFAQAPFARDFLRDVPAAWDETILLGGRPDSHVVLARRRGERWWVGGLSGLETPLELRVPLRFLDAGTRYESSLVTSGSQPDTLALQRSQVGAGTELRIDLAAKDGFAIALAPAGGVAPTP